MARHAQPNSDQYSEQETEQRFMAALKKAVNTKPTPLKDVPKKWSREQRGNGVPAQSKKRQAEAKKRA
jgi:hypothetical protein